MASRVIVPYVHSLNQCGHQLIETFYFNEKHFFFGHKEYFFGHQNKLQFFHLYTLLIMHHLHFRLAKN